MGDIVLSEVAKDLIINIINIIVLFVIVRMLVYKPVKKFLDARTEKVETMNREADERLLAAKSVDEKKDEIIAESKKTAEQIIADAEKKAHENSGRIAEKAKSDATVYMEKARDEIREEHNDLLVSAKDELTELAIGISEKILRREVNAADTEKIVDDFLSEKDSGDKA